MDLQTLTCSTPMLKTVLQYGLRCSCVISLLASAENLIAQDRRALIDFHVDTRHVVGGVSTFDRRKFITMHSSITEPDWIGDEDKLRHLVEDLDVYFGRDSGRITWALTQMREDPRHQGFVDFRFLAYYGQNARKEYANRAIIHPFSDHEDLVVTGQLHPFWPDGAKIQPPDGSPIWSIANADASGQFMAYWLNLFTGGDGPPKPRLLEIVNEPLFELSKEKSETTPREVFRYHRDAATAIRKYCPDVLIGGYTAAFPDVERDDFREWNVRWKNFIDITGDQIDFYSLHLYDFPGIEFGKRQYRKGCHLEATLDMIEHYGFLKFGEPKPFVVSEYGSQLHDWFNQPWSPYRDWLCMKACNSIMLQLMRRPDRMLKTIPFITAKSEWGYDEGGSGQPYYWRLLRRENEPSDFSGEYVFTDQIKFYQLWSDVRGTRIVADSNDPNLLCDGYVDGHHVSLIINNLTTDAVALDLTQIGVEENRLIQAFGKHLYPYDEKPRLDVFEVAENKRPLVLGAEATMILRFSYAEPIAMTQTMTRTKNYASSQLKPIKPGEPLVYEVSALRSNAKSRATLRLGVGRPHGKSLKPHISVNGSTIPVPDSYRGPSQQDRESFFGVLEISVPPSSLEPKSIIEIVFPDGGGHISSIALEQLQ